MKYAVRTFATLIAAFSPLVFAASAVAQQNSVLYDFTATWCGPCQQMNPIVHKLEREGLPIRQVDIDKQPDLARKYKISSIPAFVLVVDGKEIHREVGRTSEHRLRQMAAQIQKQQPSSQQPEQSIAPNSRPNRNRQNVIAQGNSGYETPSLGQNAPFPADSSAASATRSNAPRREMAQQSAPPANSDSPIFRAQSDDTQAVDQNQPVADSGAANVRIRIRDNKGINYGSGTVVDSRSGKTYILTCGHIFRGLSDSSKIDVDIFAGGEFESFSGEVVNYDLPGDVGLLMINSDKSFPVAQIAQTPTKLSQGDAVISVGCSGGETPTVQNLQVTALNRYNGPDNVECTGLPVQGRSGGGLFNENQEVVGVCIAADPKEKRGLYAGLDPIVGLLTESGLSHVIRRENGTGNPRALVETNGADNSPDSPADPFPQDFNNHQAEPPQTAMAENSSAPPPAANAPSNGKAIAKLNSAKGAKLTIIIEKEDAPGETEVVIIPAATARLLADLTGELEETRSIATNRQETPVEGHAATSHERNSVVPLASDARELREDDRMTTIPTGFPAAQRYRRK